MGLLIALESSGQIATKVGGDQLGQMDFSLQWLQAVMLNPGVWVAIAGYIGAFFVWMLILRRSSLSLAFPLSSLVFVGVEHHGLQPLQAEIHLPQLIAADLGRNLPAADRKSTRLNSSHYQQSRMPSSA